MINQKLSPGPVTEGGIENTNLPEGAQRNLIGVLTSEELLALPASTLSKSLILQNEYRHAAATLPEGTKVDYFLHRSEMNGGNIGGTGVVLGFKKEYGVTCVIESDGNLVELSLNPQKYINRKGVDSAELDVSITKDRISVKAIASFSGDQFEKLWIQKKSA